MSKKKRLLFICSIVILFVTFLLSIFVFMAVKETKVNIADNSHLNSQEILNKLNSLNIIPYGSSILFVNRNSISSNIEKAIPELKINSIETEFPNRIKINCEERIGLFYVERNGSALIVDKEMKIISVVSLSKARDEGLVEFVLDSNLRLSENEWELGSKLQYKYINECTMLYDKILTQYEINSYEEIFCNHFNKISLTQGFDKQGKKCAKLIFYLSSAKEVEFENPEVDTERRVGLLIAITGDTELLKDKIVLDY